ncbi:hypothetical protein OAT93_01750 [bacterium]|nr:hypothetical protein [bacterium]
MSNIRPRQKKSVLKNVTPFIIPDPTGVDAPIKDIQEHFTNTIPWLSKSFNRAEIMSRNDSEDEVIYPKGWVNDNVDEMEMIALDYWDSYSFFVADDNETIIDFNEFGDNIYQRDVSIYFWFNLYDISKNNVEYNGKTYPFQDELKRDILGSLTTLTLKGDNNLEITNIENNHLNVYEKFTFNVTDKQFYYPFKILRIDMNLSYEYNNC